MIVTLPEEKKSKELLKNAQICITGVMQRLYK